MASASAVSGRDAPDALRHEGAVRLASNPTHASGSMPIPYAESCMLALNVRQACGHHLDVRTHRLLSLQAAATVDAGRLLRAEAESQSERFGPLRAQHAPSRYESVAALVTTIGSSVITAREFVLDSIEFFVDKNV